MKRKSKRVLTSVLATFLCVAMNINPIASVAVIVAESNVVGTIGTIAKNIVAMSQSTDTVFAVAGETDPATINFSCDYNYSQLIGGLTESGESSANLATINNTLNNSNSTLTDINGNIISIGSGVKAELTTISGYMPTAIGHLESISETESNILDGLGYDASHTLSGDLANMQTQLTTINNTLLSIQNTIQQQQHKYFVAHLKSLNNTFANSLWRPTTDDLPYVEDFATVWGGFANVYSGYWNTAISDVKSNLYWRKTYSSSDPNEFIYDYDRYATVLGDDIILRREGVIPQQNGVFNNSTGEFKGYLESNYFGTNSDETKLSGSPATLLALEQEVIDKDAITWLDAVTVLYKAMGQEYTTYQAYMSYNPSIRPENSPVFQNLANPIPNDATDTSHPGAYNGYDVNFFVTRSNTYSFQIKDEQGNLKPNDIYWSKAVKDGIIPSSSTQGALKDTKILASEFWQLAEDIMTAYGEPYINNAEVRALLQVYGSDYPIQLGYQVADAWAYLKVRGCLECPMYASNTVTRDQLLDVATRIKDKDFRGDYKVINVTLDLADVMQDSGYYPVYDLTTTTNTFNVTTTIDYTQLNYYSYVLQFTENVNIGTVGDLRVYKAPERSDANLLEDYSVEQINISGADFYVVNVKCNYNGNIYLARTTFGDVTDTPNGTVDFLCVPASETGGGLYKTGATTNGVYVYNTPDALSNYNGYSELQECNDYGRAGKTKPMPAEASANASMLGSIKFAWQELTTPMEVKAASFNADAFGGTSNPVVKISKQDLSNKGATEEETSAFESAMHNKIENKIAGTPSVMEGATFDNAESAGYRLIKAGDTQLLYAASGTNDLFMSIARACLISMSSSMLDLAANPQTISGQQIGLPVILSRMQTAASISAAGFNTNDTVRDVVNGLKSNDAYFAKTTYTRKKSAGSEDTMSKDLYMTGATWLAYYKYGFVPNSYCVYSQKGDDYYTDDIVPAKYTLEVSTDTTVKNKATDWYTFLNDENSIEWNAAARWYNELGCTRVTKQSNSALWFYTTQADAVKSAFTKEAIVSTASYSNQDKADGDAARIDLPMTVASDAIMKKDQQILLRWTDLVKCGYVVPTDTGSLPTLQKDGSLYFYTYKGQVKVNNTYHTIQIGTTIYDLAYDTDADSPVLYYFDNEQGQSGELYIDYRCVLGIVRERVRYDDDAHIVEMDTSSLGCGNAVVYDLGSTSQSNQFQVKQVNTYNYPDIPNAFKNVLDNVNGYPIDVITSTYYDDVELTGVTAGLKYWPPTSAVNSVRMAVSSFVPTANWTVVIDQNSNDESDTFAYLFIWYPREPFINGYMNNNNSWKKPEENLKEKEQYYSNWEDMVTNANAKGGGKLTQALQSSIPGYGEDMKWYDQRTCAAAAKLYEITGEYYLSSDYCMRYIELTNSSVINASNVFTDVQPDSELLSNNAGTMYWVTGIGFVYNMPTVTDFTLEQYFDGKYLLPLACDTTGSLGASYNIINYNMSYYGYAKVRNSVNGGKSLEDAAIDDSCWTADAGNDYEIPYGNVLAADGIYNYASNTKIEKLGKEQSGAAINLPTGDEGKVTVEPIMLDYFVPAPSGVFLYFGSCPIEQQDLKNVTNWASYRNSIFYGSTQIMMQSSTTTSSGVVVRMFGTQYAPITLNGSTVAHRTIHLPSRDVLNLEPQGLMRSGGQGLMQVIDEDVPTNEIIDWLDGVGANDLLTRIDKNASTVIVIAFKVMPWIGIILMSILVGLAFLADVKMFRVLCSKVIDPVKILTLGRSSIDYWSWKRVLVPCILLYTVFALFLNGNIIRVIMWGAKWYGVVSQWIKNL